MCLLAIVSTTRVRPLTVATARMESMATGCTCHSRWLAIEPHVLMYSAAQLMKPYPTRYYSRHHVKLPKCDNQFILTTTSKVHSAPLRHVLMGATQLPIIRSASPVEPACGVGPIATSYPCGLAAFAAARSDFGPPSLQIPASLCWLQASVCIKVLRPKPPQ